MSDPNVHKTVVRMTAPQIKSLLSEEIEIELRNRAIAALSADVVRRANAVTAEDLARRAKDFVLKGASWSSFKLTDEVKQGIIENLAKGVRDEAGRALSSVVEEVVSDATAETSLVNRIARRAAREVEESLEKRVRAMISDEIGARVDKAVEEAVARMFGRLASGAK